MRFYYNVFDVSTETQPMFEWEIIDAESFKNYPNHDPVKDIPDWYTYLSYPDSSEADKLCAKLNELDQMNKFLLGMLKFYTEDDCEAYYHFLKELERIRKDVCNGNFDEFEEIKW